MMAKTNRMATMTIVVSKVIKTNITTTNIMTKEVNTELPKAAIIKRAMRAFYPRSILNFGLTTLQCTAETPRT
jgi:hypothetical protein